MSRPRFSNLRESALATLIDTIHKEKNIPKEIVINIIEKAMQQAAKKAFGLERDLEVTYNPNSKQEITIFEFKTIVEDVTDPHKEISLTDALEKDDSEDFEIGDEIGIPLDIHPQDLGRIAAQAAKQHIIQQVRNAEREIIYNEFKDRKGELIAGIVRRFEKGDVILELGKAEAILRKKEQINTETYRPGDSIQAYLLDINHSSRQPQVELSRTHVNLIVKLFELEVPEIRQELVQIVACARVPGERAKIAVRSNVEDVDPVGACVGLRGSRVQEVVRALNGEAIDIVPWSEDPLEFVRGAIAPAIMTRGIIYYDQNDKKNIEIVVPDDQLSKAIGRQGQNVRLASQLTRFKIDIHSESKYKKMIEVATEELSRIDGLDEESIEILIQHRYLRIAQVYDEDPKELSEILEIPEETASEIIENAATALDQLTEEEKQERLAKKSSNVE
jgi:transcription termination/antitermination protein NusA